MSDRAPASRLVVGVMSGTSLDGIDAAAATVTGRGLRLRAAILRHEWIGLGETASALCRAASGVPMTAAEFAGLALALGARYAEAIERVAATGRPDLIAIHGQTIFHRPPLSWQIINPAPVAERFGCPVVFDLRQADLAAGGQGAPVTPIADWVLFRDADRRRAVVNLGGYCNVTILPRGGDMGAIMGFDICACNQVLDEVARRALGAPYDEGGRAAASGTGQAPAVEGLRSVLETQRAAARSLGSGDEARQWVDAWRERLAPNDLAASAVEAIALTITAFLAAHDIDEAVLAGGGVRHAALVSALSRHVARPLRTSDDLGVPHAAREALAMAVLGALCADGVPITLPQVTGCRTPAPLSGSWVLPATPASLTDPAATSPSAPGRRHAGAGR